MLCHRCNGIWHGWYGRHAGHGGWYGGRHGYRLWGLSLWRSIKLWQLCTGQSSVSPPVIFAPVVSVESCSTVAQTWLHVGRIGDAHMHAYSWHCPGHKLCIAAFNNAVRMFSMSESQKHYVVSLVAAREEPVLAHGTSCMQHSGAVEHVVRLQYHINKLPPQ